MALNWLNTIIILLTAYGAAFLQAAWDGPRLWLGMPINLLPLLAVYVGLTANVSTALWLAWVGGVGLDALSENPLGTTVLPLFCVSWLCFLIRELVLRERIVTQMLMGAVASVFVPALSLVLLTLFPPSASAVSLSLLQQETTPGLELGYGPAWLGGVKPLASWSTLVLGFMMASICALLTPLLFHLLDQVSRLFSYPSVTQTPFRSDREIKRGRSL